MRCREGAHPRLAPLLASLAMAAVGWMQAALSHAQVDLLEIIVAVDNSGSMDEEVAEVELALPGLVDRFEAIGLETRLILISDASNGSNGICLAAPLGSGSCPGDENLPRYRHVVDAVGGNAALMQILDHYDDYSASLRPGSRRSILVVSDDDSDLGAAAFTSQLLTLPGFDDFRFHAAALALEPIPPPPPPGVCWRDGQAGTQGTVYLELVASRFGYLHDYCVSEDLDPSWVPLARTVGLFFDSFDSGGLEDWSSSVP